MAGYGMDTAALGGVDEQERAGIPERVQRGRDNGKGENGQITRGGAAALEVNSGTRRTAGPQAWNQRTRGAAMFGERRGKDGR
ncbi:MAG: hypothetical protein ACLR7U_10840 [Ruthenibacterium lactatiformans]